MRIKRHILDRQQKRILGKERVGDDKAMKDFRALFSGLTNKQHEVMRLVSDNFTSKEIAFELGISESAVNQRIEAVRTRAGSPPRAELARAYRQYVQGAEPLQETYSPLPDKILQVPEYAPAPPVSMEDERRGQLALSDAVPFNVTPPWQRRQHGRIVPEVLDGTNAGLNRTAAIIVIAVGVLLLALGGLGMVRTLSDMFGQ